jgi:hypothetical protein
MSRDTKNRDQLVLAARQRLLEHLEQTEQVVPILTRLASAKSVDIQDVTVVPSERREACYIS